jgi:hypothetical protein
LYSSDCKTDARQYSIETLIEKRIGYFGNRRAHQVEELNIFNTDSAFQRGSSLKDVGFKDDSEGGVSQN